MKTALSPSIAARAAFRSLPFLVTCFLIGTNATAADAGAAAAGYDRAAADAVVRQAWVELAQGNQALVRAVVEGDVCPQIAVDGQVAAMTLRAASGTPAQRPTASAASDSKPSAFPVASCEYRLPSGAQQAWLGSHSLPLPKSQPLRIAILADTGCRMKKADDAWQSCNDADAWPLATIAASAAALHPDLVLHLGDYHYRENACPSDIAGCQNSPWGYGWDVWEADLFKPAAPLLAAAPWIVVRGNHEECRRAGQGWFRFLDTQAYDSKRSCDDPDNDNLANYSAPYAVALGKDTQLIVFDSSKASNQALSPDSLPFQKYQQQLQAAAQLAAAPGVNSIFVNHHPVLALAPITGATVMPGNRALQSVMATATPNRYFPPGVVMAIHGHVHDFQAINFASDHPATLVSGNGGDASDVNFPDPLPKGMSPAPDAQVDQFTHTNTFGFMMMERQSDGHWAYQAYDRKGGLLATCRQDGSKLHCDKSGFLAPL